MYWESVLFKIKIFSYIFGIVGFGGVINYYDGFANSNYKLHNKYVRDFKFCFYMLIICMFNIIFIK